MSRPDEPVERDDAIELAHMDEVDVHPDAHRATEPDEEEVLRELYGAPDGVDTAAAAASTAAAMLKAARATLGMSGRPNTITREYASRHGDAFLRAAWCDMAVTYWARHSSNAAAVLPSGDRAYTVWHAQDFQKAGRWFSGTAANVNKARPGDIVFFDWGNSNTVSAIDHVGVVEKVLGDGRLQTIEGNTGDAVKRRVRSASVIAGYGRPAYGSKGQGSGVPAWPGRYITQPPVMRGDDVRTWQKQMRERGFKITVDGAYGPASEKICRAFQKDSGLQVDGIVGPATWRAAWEAPFHHPV